MATALLPRMRRAPDPTKEVRLLRDLYLRHGKHSAGDVVTVSEQLADALIETRQAELPSAPTATEDKPAVLEERASPQPEAHHEGE